MADDDEEDTEIIRLGGTPEDWEEGLKRLAERDKRRRGETPPIDKIHGRAGRRTPVARC